MESFQPEKLYSHSGELMIRRVISAFIKRWGTPGAKQRIWDSEYKTGKWTYDRNGQHNEAGEPVYKLLKKYGTHGTILDLGCGSGMTALEMDNSFQSYVGVDVSDVAIEKARIALSTESGRASKVQFCVSDISTFVPDREFSVILFRESIYYVPQPRLKGMLDTYCSNLTPGGVFIIRLCDRNKYRQIINLLEKTFQVVERYNPDDSPMTILVCSPNKAG